MWDHVIANWTTRHGRSWLPLDIVRDWVSGPSAIIQDFGFLGVTIFFVLSGYIISEVAVRESRRVFAIKRLLRIYPALVVSVLIIVGLDALRPHLGLPHEGFGLKQSAWAATLLNYVRAAESPVNGVAWSLVVEVMFYGLVFVCLGLLKRRPLVAIGAEMACVLVVLLTARDFPVDSAVPNWFLVGASAAYLPLLMIGQAVWLWRSGRASARVAAVTAFAAWLLFVLGMRRIHSEFLSPANSYGVSAILASALFIAVVANEERIRVPRWIAALSVISYSAYLIHGPLTEMIMDRLAPSLPFTVHMLIAVAVLAIAAVLMWRLVEVPSQTLARRLTRPRVETRPAEPTNIELPATHEVRLS